MNSLPIEKDRDLLAEYGRAFAWLNLVESYLDRLLIVQGKTSATHPSVMKKLMENKTFGAKVGLSQDLIDDQLYKDLNTLNTKRNILAHSSIGERVVIGNNVHLPTGQFWVNHKNREHQLSKESLNEIIVLAEDACKRIHKTITPLYQG